MIVARVPPAWKNLTYTIVDRVPCSLSSGAWDMYSYNNINTVDDDDDDGGGADGYWWWYNFCKSQV